MCFNSVPCPFSPEAIHLISIIQHSQATQNIHTKDENSPTRSAYNRLSPGRSRAKLDFKEQRAN